MSKLLCIVGPTSTGKTDLAIYIAKKLNGEIISADSRQVYKGLDIGTGKMSSEGLSVTKKQNCWEIDGIKIWMYDVVDPNIQYTVSRFVKDANFFLENVVTSGKLPIIVGGTGLYIKAITEGLPNLEVPIDKNLRIKLENLSLLDLQNKLKKISIEKWNSMNYSDQQNPRRLVRAIELYMLKKGIKIKKKMKSKYDILKIGLTASRGVLYKRSDERVIKRINKGMIDEALSLQEQGMSFQRFKQLGLEYGVLADYLDGKINSKDILINTLQLKIHGYIRRQQTWFKKEENVHWFNIISKDCFNKIEKNVRKWYDTN